MITSSCTGYQEWVCSSTSSGMWSTGSRYSLYYPSCSPMSGSGTRLLTLTSRRPIWGTWSIVIKKSRNYSMMKPYMFSITIVSMILKSTLKSSRNTKTPLGNSLIPILLWPQDISNSEIWNQVPLCYLMYLLSILTYYYHTTYYFII